mgnify:CR=1 FL=1|jgi:hypothetical protein
MIYFFLKDERSVDELYEFSNMLNESNDKHMFFCLMNLDDIKYFNHKLNIEPLLIECDDDIFFDLCFE